MSTCLARIISAYFASCGVENCVLAARCGASCSCLLRLFTGQTVGLYLRIRANSAISTVGIPLHPNLPRRER
jgi:hypothetical protein